MDPSKLERWSATAMDTSRPAQERWERDPDYWLRWANGRRREMGMGELPLTFPSVEEAEEEPGGGG